jgi:hypothetical protein
MTHTMRELLQMAMAGQPLPPIDEQNSRRVYCRDCLDEGVIRIWHPKTIIEARALIQCARPLTELETHYDAVAACSCSRGDAYHKREQKGGDYRVALPRFNEHQHCRLAFGTKNSQDHETLETWIANWRPENYEKSFDQFNTTGYVNTELDF